MHDFKGGSTGFVSKRNANHRPGRANPAGRSQRVACPTGTLGDRAGIEPRFVREAVARRMANGTTWSPAQDRPEPAPVGKLSR